MADSDIDEELFADNSDGGNAASNRPGFKIRNDSEGEQLSEDSSVEDQIKPPEYIDFIEFKAFVRDNKIEVSNKYGFISVFLYRPFYFPG